ncbi:MAG: HlyD family efflux transporter periplasmic adaptor subunit [Deltaproteobacteria bacterium]|nr:HlyD family efflux transporter periplasmic adaptor subunit [Deltaproteobacteria bacterium]
MKKIIHSTLILSLVSLISFSISSCSKKEKTEENSIQNDKPGHEHPQKIEYYTCSMHPQIHRDKPGTCPICGMSLVPVYQEEGGMNHTHSIQLNEDKIQKTGIKVAPVEKKKISLLLKAAGRISSNADLYLAEQEFLIAQRTNPSLAQATRNKLMLLGLNDQQIQELAQNPKSVAASLFPHSNAQSWVEAFFPQSDATYLKEGAAAQVIENGKPRAYAAKLISISPILDPNTKTIVTRLLLEDASPMLKGNQALQVQINYESQEMTVIPNSALVNNGEESFVFLALGEGRFEKQQVQVKLRGEKEVAVDGLETSQKVVSEGNFLLDSEVNLKS